MKRTLLSASALLLLLSLVPSAQAGEKNNNNAKDGDKCQVTSGPNKGKTGTYTEGGTWCEGSRGGTECGTDKCKAALTSPIHPFPVATTNTLNEYFTAANSGDPQQMKAWETKNHATAEKKSDGSLVIKLPNKTLVFDGDQQKLAENLKKK
jgi:hypothetical protein